MRALYEIEFDLENLVEFDEETGEILNPEVLEALEAERERKIEGMALWVKNLDAEAEAIKTEEAALKARRQSKEKKAESIRKFLTNVLDNNGKFETAKVAISFRTSREVVIDDLDLIPEEFIETKTEVSPIKADIKKALKAGDVPGAHMSDPKYNIQIK